MSSLFDLINKTNETTRAAQSSQPKPVVPQANENINTVIARWQQNNNTDDAGKILKFLAPTISSAINTYANGTKDKFKVKAASIALNTLKSFDPSRGVDPRTYAFHGLKRLSRLNADRSTVVSVPEGQRLQYAMLSELSKKFEDEKDREPSVTELADMSGIPEKRIEKIFSNNTVFNDSSAVNPETGESTFGVSGMTDDDYLKYVYVDASPTDKKILEWSSGLHGKPLLGTQDIAKRLKLTPAAISQRKAKLLSKLSEMRSLL